MSDSETDTGAKELNHNRFKDCDNPGCDRKFNITSGVDHWVDVTEFDTTAMIERRYCSLDCAAEDIPGGFDD
jgi:hypothetical protein